MGSLDAHGCFRAWAIRRAPANDALVPPNILTSGAWAVEFVAGQPWCGGVLVLCGFLVPISIAELLLCRRACRRRRGTAADLLRDTPESVGLPEVKARFGRCGRAEVSERAQETSVPIRIFLFSLANFFVYTVRYWRARLGADHAQRGEGH